MAINQARQREREAAEATVWDISRQAETERFRQKVNNPIWRETTAHWYASGEQWVRQLHLTRQELQGEVYTETNTGAGDRHYARFVVGRAKEMLAQLYPELRDTLDLVEQKTVLVHPDAAAEDYWLAFAITDQIGKIFSLQFPLDLEQSGFERYFDEYHGLRVMAVAHELAHGVIYQKYGLVCMAGHDPSAVGFAHVLHELGAYAFMPEMYHRFKEATSERSSLAGLAEYFDRYDRMVQWANPLRRFPAAREEDDLLRHYLPYLSALQVAGRLEKNGWTYRDFPELAKEVEKIVAQELGEKYRQKIAVLPLTTESSSPAQRILARIRSLKPPKA